MEQPAGRLAAAAVASCMEALAAALQVQKPDL